jgi:hypothetical protein
VLWRIRARSSRRDNRREAAANRNHLAGQAMDAYVGRPGLIKDLRLVTVEGGEPERKKE